MVGNVNPYDPGPDCRREVYSTHPLQTGWAGGAAAAQLGLRALAPACDRNKAKGLSLRQTSAILPERQLRPAVVARKTSCGNKTPQGALAWAIQTSLAATCRQTARSVVHVISSQILLQPVRGP